MIGSAHASGALGLAWFVAAVCLLALGVVAGGRPVPCPISDPSSGGFTIAGLGVRRHHPVRLVAPVVGAGRVRRAADGALALATSGPLSLVSVTHLSPVPAMAGEVMAGLVALPLGWMLADGLADRGARARARWALRRPLARRSSAGAGRRGPRPWTGRWALASAVALVPALLAGATFRRTGGGWLPHDACWARSRY
ncbi:MAG: hypothetical protein U0667_05610 [Chloroflexota bacterium]